MTKDWRSIAITMNPSSQRFKSFQKKNLHLDCEIFEAINGQTLDFQELVKNGLITEDLSKSPVLTKGAAGCAAATAATTA